MTITSLDSLKTALVNEVSRYFNTETTLGSITMYRIAPRKGYEYGLLLKHSSRRTLLKFYFKKGKVFFLSSPTRMITRPKVVGIGDESLVFIGTIDLDITDLLSVLPDGSVN